MANNELKEIMYQYDKSKISNKVKDISIKNRTYYFFDDSNIKSLTNKLASKCLQKKFLFTALDM